MTYHKAGGERTERRFRLPFKFCWTASGLRTQKDDLNTLQNNNL